MMFGLGILEKPYEGHVPWTRSCLGGSVRTSPCRRSSSNRLGALNSSGQSTMVFALTWWPTVTAVVGDKKSGARGKMGILRAIVILMETGCQMVGG